MRNLYFLKHLTVLFLLFSALSLFAQGFIMEQKQTLPDNLKIESNFGKQNYTNILNENGKSVSVLNQNSNNESNSTTGEDNINDVTLSIDLVFDSGQAPWIVMIYDESDYIDYAFSPGTNLVTFNVPPGTYDVFADFSFGNTSHIVIKELVDVSGNTTIQLIAAEADNYISVNTYDETGEILEPGIYNPETETSSVVFFDRVVRFTPGIVTAAYEYIVSAPFEEDALWNFYINDVSDRYAVINSFIGIGFGEEHYISKSETLSGVSGSVNLENDPDKWSFHLEKFQPGVLGESGGVYPAFSTLSTFENRARQGRSFSFTGSQVDPEEAFKAFLNNPLDGDPADLLVFPAIVDHIGLADPWWVEEGFLITGNAVVSDEDGGVRYGSGSSYFSMYFLGNLYYVTEPGTVVMPFHPKFSYSSTNVPNAKQGDGTPIAITMVRAVPNEWNFLYPQYKGRYGENRESDFFVTQIEAKHNESVIFSGNYIDFTWEYGIFGAGLPVDGQIEISLTNTNIVVDGLEGKNTLNLSYNAGEADSPPTIQALQFRSSSDEVTSSFESAAEGTLRLSAGDFQFNPGSYFYNYNEGNTVEVYYSLYNQNNWTELELNEYPEYFQMPAFGNYYEASLENVVVTEENSWFDVKIICTDAAGNKQEQIVSPAFKIGEINLGIEETDNSSFVVYPNPFSGELNVQLPENVKGNYTFKVTDLSGKTVHSQNRNADSAKSFTWNGSYLPKGIYICSILSNGKTIAKKVIKK